MEEKAITKCPHCGGETHVQGVSFCPFCGNSLLGEIIVATNQSVKEEAYELEDRNLVKINGAEYPTILSSIVTTIAIMIVYTIVSCDIGFVGLLSIFSGEDLVGTIVMIFVAVFGIIVYLTIALVFILKHIDDFRKRKLFKEGNKAVFDAEVRSYGSKSVNGKEKQFITIKGDCGGEKAFNVYTKNKKRQFYIGETIKVTVANGVYLLEKKTEN